MEILKSNYVCNHSKRSASSTYSVSKMSYEKPNSHEDIFTNEQIAGACSVSFRGEMFIYGGQKNQQQVKKLDCKNRHFTMQAKLTFDFVDGACTANDDFVALCFSKTNTKQCYQSRSPVAVNWWEQFLVLPESYCSHYLGAIAISSGTTLKVTTKNFNFRVTVCYRQFKSLKN